LLPPTLQPALTEINRGEIVVKPHKWGQTPLPAGRRGGEEWWRSARQFSSSPAETAEMAEMVPNPASLGSGV
jgi:hypothetical protein